MKKIFAYKSTVKIAVKQLKEIEAEGYIPIRCENLHDIKIVESFPDVDSTWMVSAMLDLIMNDDGYNGTRAKFSHLLLQHLKRKVTPTPK